MSLSHSALPPSPRISFFFSSFYLIFSPWKKNNQKADIDQQLVFVFNQMHSKELKLPLSLIRFYDYYVRVLLFFWGFFIPPPMHLPLQCT